MEAVVGSGRGHAVGGGEVAGERGLIDVHESGPPLGEQPIRFAAVPGRVAKLHRQRQRLEPVEECAKRVAVVRSVVEGERVLDQNRSQPLLAGERLHGGKEGLLLGRPGVALVGEAPVQLGREGEARIVRDPPRPVARLARVRNPVEGRVDLVGVEERCQQREPVEASRRALRVDDAAPVLVGPTRGSDPDLGTEPVRFRPTSSSSAAAKSNVVRIARQPELARSGQPLVALEAQHPDAVLPVAADRALNSTLTRVPLAGTRKLILEDRKGLSGRRDGLDAHRSLRAFSIGATSIAASTRSRGSPPWRIGKPSGAVFFPAASAGKTASSDSAGPGSSRPASLPCSSFMRNGKTMFAAMSIGRPFFSAGRKTQARAAVIVGSTNCSWVVHDRLDVLDRPVLVDAADQDHVALRDRVLESLRVDGLLLARQLGAAGLGGERAGGREAAGAPRSGPHAPVPSRARRAW